MLPLNTRQGYTQKTPGLYLLNPQFIIHLSLFFNLAYMYFTVLKKDGEFKQIFLDESTTIKKMSVFNVFYILHLLLKFES